MQYLDILFFAALAIFLWWKLYSVLGRRDGNGGRRFDPFARRPTRPAAPASLPAPARRGAADAREREAARPTPERRRLEAQLAKADAGLRDGLAAIGRADPAFDAVAFIAGARQAFEMILTAFAAGDKAMLAQLLAPEVLPPFETAIDERQRRGHTLKTTLAGLKAAEITAAALSGREVRIAVRFESEQISVTLDENGRVLDGDPTAVIAVIDVFTFARDVDSPDPNWRVVATQSPE